jgi:Transposase IS66 family
MPSRAKTSIADLEVLSGWHGYLVRDDYAGRHQFDPHLAGVQQCCAHLIRHCTDVLPLHPNYQQWAAQVITVLRETAAAVEQARAAGADRLDPDHLANLRARYDKVSRVGHHHQPASRLAPAQPSRLHPRPTPQNQRLNKSGCSPETSRSPGRTTPQNRHARVRNATRPSPDTGTAPTPSATTSASAPTSPAPTATASAPSTPSTPPSPDTPDSQPQPDHPLA